MDWEKEVDIIYESILNNPLVATNKDWLQRAIEAKCAHLTVGVAYSKLLVYDWLDERLLTVISSNSKN
jgi:hypothetical protein